MKRVLSSVLFVLLVAAAPAADATAGTLGYWGGM